MMVIFFWLFIGSISLNLLWVEREIGHRNRSRHIFDLFKILLGPITILTYFFRLRRGARYLFLGDYSTPRIELAQVLCREWHRDQVRKYTGEPYSNHPIAVAQIVTQYTHDEVTIASAYLHDCIEDTNATYEEIFSIFGEEIAKTVRELTNEPSQGNRSREEKTIQTIERLKFSNNKTKLIKMADILHNISNIARLDPKFAEVYLKEKESLLPWLKEGSAELHAKVVKCIDENRMILKNNP